MVAAEQAWAIPKRQAIMPGQALEPVKKGVTAENMLALRTEYLSDRWDKAWQLTLVVWVVSLLGVAGSKSPQRLRERRVSLRFLGVLGDSAVKKRYDIKPATLTERPPSFEIPR